VPVSDPSVPTTATTLAGTGGGGGGGGVATGPIPKVITVAYVDAVFAQLDALIGNAERSTKVAGKVTQQAIRDMYGVFSPSIAAEQIRGLSVAVQLKFKNVRPNPGNIQTYATRLISGSSSCIFAVVHTDFSATVYKVPKVPTVEYEGLARTTVFNVREGNQTGWMVFFLYEYFSAHTLTSQCK
jgi:hypothetical protein